MKKQAWNVPSSSCPTSEARNNLSTFWKRCQCPCRRASQWPRTPSSSWLANPWNLKQRKSWLSSQMLMSMSMILISESERLLQNISIRWRRVSLKACFKKEDRPKGLSQLDLISDQDHGRAQFQITPKTNPLTKS